jgi:hypothetical protein
MNLIMGYANPSLQRALLQLAFADEKLPADLALLDDALIRDTLSGEQLRVLPLLYRITSLEGMSAESRTKVLGIYKHTLCRNTLMLNRLDDLKVRFQALGFERMIGIKGLPALAYLNEGLGARPMADVDVLIQALDRRLDQALATLNDLGYQQKAVGVRALTVKSIEGFEIDMHWHVHDWALGEQLVELVQEEAREHMFASWPFLIPCVEHHLAHTLAHGVLTNTLTFDARWVFDFLAVYLRHPNFDDDRFVKFANQVAAPERIRDALQALIDETPASIRFDREKLARLKTLVRTNRSVVTWLYTTTPKPNIGPSPFTRTSRVDRVKQLIISYYLMPKKISATTGRGYWRYCLDLWGGPRSRPLGGFSLAFKKLILRGPVLLYRLILGR